MRASLPLSASLPAPRPARFSLPRLVHLLTLGRTRKQLRGLDAHMLNDIGLSREAADRESERPIWDVPQGWRK
ncbi:DUF1127 domain-containing protein [Dinoroseobacter sp. S76]|uniref:DUF1127 domain-containing protein n=1 Tax=Dinoroseobacter sp. S76 TaxID=3415124 RepID=UPI003C7C0442